MAGLADRVSGELLVITGRRDRLFDWRDAERLASEVGRHAELWVLDEGNHGCANVVYRHRPQSADWLAHRLGASTPENEQQD